MSKHTESAVYSPYGAYELKAKYQKNFMLGTIITTAFVAAIVLGAWLVKAIQGSGDETPISDKIVTIAELGPPPTIIKRPPEVTVQPQVQKPKVGLPVAVADDEVLEEEVLLATKEELADISAPDVGSSEGIVVDTSEDYIPGMDEFVPVEILPEMIHEVTPEYPRLAREAGLEGVVWIKALVNKEGNVINAAVFKSSGVASLDDAAVAVAKQNKFKPGIQNGAPVICWVSYKCVFKLS